MEISLSVKKRTSCSTWFSSILSYLKPKSNVITPSCYIADVVIGHGSHPKRRRGDSVRFLRTDDLVRPLCGNSKVPDEVIVPLTACEERKEALAKAKHIGRSKSIKYQDVPSSSM